MKQTHSNSRRSVYFEGLRDGFPIGLGYFAVSFSLGIAARANYSNLTLENVFETEGDDLLDLLCDIAEYQYPLEKELFRTGFVFHYKDSLVTYHKTLPFSKIDGKVGDIIIRQSGLIYDDWNNYGSPMDINELTLI